jgi:hypothetical protein
MIWHHHHHIPANPHAHMIEVLIERIDAPMLIGLRSFACNQWRLIFNLNHFDLLLVSLSTQYPYHQSMLNFQNLLKIKKDTTSKTCDALVQ